MCFCFFHNLAPIGTTIPVGVVLAPDVPFLQVESQLGIPPPKVGVVLAPDVPFLHGTYEASNEEVLACRRGTCAGCTIPTRFINY